MKDLTIKYRNGRFHILEVDGVEVTGITSLYLAHPTDHAVPELTMSLSVYGKESISTARIEDSEIK
ncbi:hypothetical protein [Yersinia alsatica]|uniref:hypothetical protein n=1 Tax=Yersinia alsatica TaxID=2890317 RepID=UPI0011A89BED|nr:hypothetical protein [Yersinia alsatica]